AQAEREPTALGVRADRIHPRSTGGNRATAQIVAMGEAAGNDDEISPGGKRMLRMPHHRGLAAGDEPQGARHVTLAIDAREDENGCLHQRPSSFSAQRSTRSVLRKSSAMRSAALSCA